MWKFIKSLFVKEKVTTPKKEEVKSMPPLSTSVGYCPSGPSTGRPPANASYGTNSVCVTRTAEDHTYVPVMPYDDMIIMTAIIANTIDHSPSNHCHSHSDHSHHSHDSHDSHSSHSESSSYDSGSCDSGGCDCSSD